VFIGNIVTQNDLFETQLPLKVSFGRYFK
jgi:hypothetical protein